jgi:hypothetical protein
VLGDWRSYAMVLRYAHLAPSHAAEAAQRVAQWAHSEIRARRPRKKKKRRKSRRKLVERKGIEPSTFALRTRRSPS